MRTIDLLERALKVQNAAAWAKTLGVSNAAFTQAKKRGHLSPAIAGNLAIDLGEDPAAWMALAAYEAEPNEPLRKKLKEIFTNTVFFKNQASVVLAQTEQNAATVATTKPHAPRRKVRFKPYFKPHWLHEQLQKIMQAIDFQRNLAVL